MKNPGTEQNEIKHIGEIPAETKRQIALELKAAKKKGEKTVQILEKWVERTGRSKKTILRYARQHGFSTGRKKRTDAFKIDPELDRHLTNINYIRHYKNKKNAKESNMPFWVARKIYENSLRAKGENAELPSDSWMLRLSRRKMVSRSHARERTPHIDMASLHPNHVHQLDFSVCRYYFDSEKHKLVYLRQAEDYKNKVGPLGDKKKRQLKRMVIIDHATGAFYVKYYFNQKIEDIADFLYCAWENHGDDYVFHGVPEMLIMDNDTALHSYAMQRLFKYLGITVPGVEVEAARVKGVVEGFMLIWEMWFESMLRFEKPASLEEINAWAYREAIKIQQTRPHRRHGMTRFDCWDRYIGDHLREIPEREIYNQMLYSNPKTAKVRKNGIIEFKGEKYRVHDKELYGWKVDVYVHPYLYKENKTITIQFPQGGQSLDELPHLEPKTYVLAPECDSNFGVSENAIVWGEYSQDRSKTTTEKNFEKIEAAPAKEMEIKPFSQADKPKPGMFLPRMGAQIRVMPDIQGGPAPVSKFKAKQLLVAMLNRSLSEADLAAFEAKFKERTIFKADLEELAAELKVTLAKEA